MRTQSALQIALQDEGFRKKYSLAPEEMSFEIKSFVAGDPFRRDGRKGEVGFSYSLLTRNMAPLARGLISLLSACEQKLEPNLLKLADDFEPCDVEYEDEEDNDGGDKAEEKE